MDVIYVRSHPGQRQLEHHDIEGITQQRQWTVSVHIINSNKNSNNRFTTTITDPLPEQQYEILEQYLRESDQPVWSPESIDVDMIGGGTDYMEGVVQAYGGKLLTELGFEDYISPDVTECQVFIIDNNGGDKPGAAAGAGLHCLAWELLETAQPRMPKRNIRVTRICDGPTSSSSSPAPTFLMRLPQPLAVIQADPSLVFRVLLVIARDFSRTGPERDPEPDLAQWPLMKTHRRLRSHRMMLEVVRPGSREELQKHLEVRARQGVQFHLVHFDLHGRIMPDESDNLVPWLLFAKDHRAPSHPDDYSVPQTSLSKADSVARLLANHSIENVVLNACLSAYQRSGPATNLAHTFLRHGVQNVSAMWFYVHWQTVSTYLDAFYEELLVNCKSFHVAAQRGREAIRQRPTSRVGKTYQDFFLCVNYSRKVTTTTTTKTLTTKSPVATASEPLRNPSPSPSPTPSVRSNDSSTSNTSSARSPWKPPTPRLGEALLAVKSVTAGEPDPVMRMKLHLLELEYKLMTHRIVYASDLRRPDSRLASTIERMVTMWLGTNLIDEVLYYKAKDFAHRRRHILSTAAPPAPRERRSRTASSSSSTTTTPSSSSSSVGTSYLQLLLPPRPIRALAQTLHIVREVDLVVDPGTQMDDDGNARHEARRMMAHENLGRFAKRLHDDGNSYLLFLGSQDVMWFRTHLQHLGGEWWVHAPWNFTTHSRYMRDGQKPRLNSMY